MTQVARVLWSDVGRAPSPAAGPCPACQQADEASAAVQGDRPTKPMPERLPESSRYPTFAYCQSKWSANVLADRSQFCKEACMP